MKKRFSLLTLTLLLLLANTWVRWDEPELVLIEGSSFLMGDVFAEGGQDERPTHPVTVRDFLLSPHEVTVAEFRAFVAETGYETSAEGPFDPEASKAIIERATSRQLSREEMQEIHQEILRYSGAGYWAAEERRWQGYNPETNWRNPGFEQMPDHPVMAVSWDDAMHFCNWLSEKAGLPVAYDAVSGELLDEAGDPTTDLKRVRGYRLPTEAEWEYAAREGGRDVRFGNGMNTARSSEMNFRGDEGEQPYLEPGSYHKGTMPVGSFPPNSLGLYDMSGNAWEWVSDTYVQYDTTAVKDPYSTGGTKRILRGGRWGGDAFEARVFRRTSWPRNDRCNNSGFRIARSVGGA
jgi:formylglycine-generating enzyme required for sulfatase activity